MQVEFDSTDSTHSSAPRRDDVTLTDAGDSSTRRLVRIENFRARAAFSAVQCGIVSCVEPPGTAGSNKSNQKYISEPTKKWFRMTNYHLTIRQAARLINADLITSEQLSSFCYTLACAGEEVWGLNAYSKIVAREELLDQARLSDDRRRHGETLSAFDGIPISVKPNLAVENQVLTAGSLILGLGRKDATLCGYDADTVKILLRDCGALLVGMTNMDEFGMGSLGNNSRDIDGAPRFTKNPLPYLRNLNFDVSSSKSEDEAIAEIIQMPHDEMMERHADALNETDAIFSAGGSSCGSAASVAHGSALLSIGTDTGGSVRLPSAWCGLVGLKPSYGLLSRHGVVSYASSFDTIGILARSTDCASAALNVLAQRGDASRRDSTFSSYCSSGPSLGQDSVKAEKSALAGIRIGIPCSFSVEECPPEVKEAWSFAAQWLHDNGASIEEISVDDISPGLVQRALAAYYVLVSAEASSNLSRYDGFRYGVVASDEDTTSSLSDLTPLERQYSATRTQCFGTEVSRRILCGTSVLSSDRFHTHYEAAAKLRAALARQLYSVLQEKVDLLLIPTALSLPCRIDQGKVDNTEMFANDVMTVPPSLAGLPSVSIPVRIKGGDSFMGGFQLIGSRLREDIVLEAGRVLETASSRDRETSK